MPKLALEGLRVIDLTWVIAGPFATKLLADMGAEVIKVESLQKVDGLRVVGPWKTPEPTPPNRSGMFDTRNVNKLSVVLNLRRPAGVAVFKKLVGVSDVLIENFSAGTMDKFGLGYPVLQEINPKLTMVSMAGFGQTGPYRGYVGFGPNLQAISGLTAVTGWPGRIPVGIGQAYPDFISALFAVFSALVSLHGNKGKQGQYIDLSQYDCAVSVLGHSVLDYTVNGRVPPARGNRHPSAAPHGCFPCREDRWCVIAVFTDEEWAAFCRAIGSPEWTQRPEFATFLDRKHHEDELEKLVAAWACTCTAEEVMMLLQGVGVAAAVVQNLEDLLTRDPHLKARGFYQEVDHPPVGKITPEGIPFQLSETPGSFRLPAPLLGEHNEHVLKDILGMSPEEIARYAAEGAFE
ncbi:MAG: CoA transferase, partial [Chloroflexota bacterium]